MLEGGAVAPGGVATASSAGPAGWSPPSCSTNPPDGAGVDFIFDLPEIAEPAGADGMGMCSTGSPAAEPTPTVSENLVSLPPGTSGALSPIHEPGPATTGGPVAEFWWLSLDCVGLSFWRIPLPGLLSGLDGGAGPESEAAPPAGSGASASDMMGSPPSPPAPEPAGVV
jgi:hypothetical protein